METTQQTAEAVNNKVSVLVTELPDLDLRLVRTSECGKSHRVQVGQYDEDTTLSLRRFTDCTEAMRAILWYHTGKIIPAGENMFFTKPLSGLLNENAAGVAGRVMGNALNDPPYILRSADGKTTKVVDLPASILPPRGSWRHLVCILDVFGTDKYTECGPQNSHGTGFWFNTVVRALIRKTSISISAGPELIKTANELFRVLGLQTQEEQLTEMNGISFGRREIRRSNDILRDIEDEHVTLESAGAKPEAEKETFMVATPEGMSDLRLMAGKFVRYQVGPTGRKLEPVQISANLNAVERLAIMINRQGYLVHLI